MKNLYKPHTSPVVCARYGVNLIADFETSGRPGQLTCYVAVASPNRAAAVEIATAAAAAAMSGTEGRLLSAPRVTRVAAISKAGFNPSSLTVPGLLELHMSRRGA